MPQQVAPDRIVEEKRILRNVADLVAPGFQRCFAQQRTSDEDGATGRREQAGQKICKRRLAGARCTGNSDKRSRLDSDVDVVQNGIAGAWSPKQFGGAMRSSDNP